MGTWPAARFGHAAVSLYNPDKDPENPAMVLIGGCSQGDIHNDAWLFNVNTLKWRKVRDWYTSTFELSMNVTNLLASYYFSAATANGFKGPCIPFHDDHSLLHEVKAYIYIWRS